MVAESFREGELNVFDFGYGTSLDLWFIDLDIRC